MAALSASVSIESDGVYEDLERLSRIVEALARRHGERFRALERDIETLCASDIGVIPMAELPGDDGLTLVFTTPAPIEALIARAATLGVDFRR